MSNLHASVIICTHNPRLVYLARVLDALKVQTLPLVDWELLLIDNASVDPLADQFNLSWHPAGRHVREDEVGLTPARLRGIAEAKGKVLVFVDDDNILNPNFLEQALTIGANHPFLGAWGGTILPEFETEPAVWTKPHWTALAIRDVRAPMWTNIPEYWKAQPCGAGLCVRSTVARCYRQELEADTLRRKLGRAGASLMSTEDTDLVLTSERFALGWGVFPQLALTHLIPSSRVTEEYLLRLREGIATSGTALRIRRGEKIAASPVWRDQLGWLKILLKRGPRAARFYLANQRGIRAGVRLARNGN